MSPEIFVTRPYNMDATAEGDLLRASDLTAFAWVRSDGFYGWVGWDGWERQKEGPSTASGLVIFAGVEPGSAFSATAAALRFDFTTGDRVDAGSELAPFVWSWDPTTGLLDPGGGTVQYDNPGMELATFSLRYSVFEGYYSAPYGSQTRGGGALPRRQPSRWTAAPAPTRCSEPAAPTCSPAATMRIGSAAGRQSTRCSVVTAMTRWTDRRATT
jgi:hypothetical protein